MRESVQYVAATDLEVVEVGAGGVAGDETRTGEQQRRQDEPERSAPPRADDHADAADRGGGAEPALRVQPLAGDLVADRPRCGDQQCERQRHAPEVGRLPWLAPHHGRRRRRCNDVRRCFPLADLPGGCSRLPQRNRRAGEEEHDRPRAVHVTRPRLTEQDDAPTDDHDHAEYRQPGDRRSALPA